MQTGRRYRSVKRIEKSFRTCCSRNFPKQCLSLQLPTRWHMFYNGEDKRWEESLAIQKYSQQHHKTSQILPIGWLEIWYVFSRSREFSFVFLSLSSIYTACTTFVRLSLSFIDSACTTNETETSVTAVEWDVRSDYCYQFQDLTFSEAASLFSSSHVLINKNFKDTKFCFFCLPHSGKLKALLRHAQAALAFNRYCTALVLFTV